MKMTRLEWNYLQRIALDHPYFDTHELPLTEREAKAIVEANNTMTGREFVDSVYAKLGMTRPAEKKRRFGWLHAIGELFTVPPIRKIAIAVLIIVLTAVFFAATPIGRALAEDAIRYVVNLFEDKSISFTRDDCACKAVSAAYDGSSDESRQQEDGQPEAVSVKTYDAFIRATGKTPLVLPLQCSELYYYQFEEDDSLVLYTIYDTSDGHIVVSQIWNAEEALGTTLSGYTSYEKDDSIYYSIEPETAYIYCVREFEGSVVSIASKGNYALDDLITMLKTN